MADLFSTLPGIQISDNEILEAELIATQILQAKFPDTDFRTGTGLHDLVIRPAATLMALINKGQQFYFVQNTLSGISDETPSALVDSILSNWFLTRKQGSKTLINARLFFARQKDITLTSDIFFSPDNTLRYFPIANISVAKSQLTFDSFSNSYYYDIDLSAEQIGSQYDISSGSLLYFSNFDAFFLHAEINFLKSTAIPTETNTQFITRSKSAISTRNLINIPSISSNLLANFGLLNGVTSIGFGDPEMIRDLVFTYVSTLTPPTVLVHMGGMVDIYSRVPLTSQIVQLTTDANGKATLGGAVYEFSRSQVSGSGVADTLAFYLTANVSTLTSASTTATCTTGAAHGFTTGDSITIIGANQTGYNGTFTITVTSGTVFTYPVAAGLVTPATGTITANKQVPYTTTNNYASIQTLASLTSVSTVATATLNNHGFTVGRWVKIASASPSAYNGWFPITAVTANTFTYTFAGGTSPATGTITVTATVPQTDFGFSNSQLQTIDFTNTYANKTASFLTKTFLDIDGLQTYLNDSTNRVLCANYLARGYNLYLLTLNITGYNGPAPDSTLCTTIVNDYLTSLAPGAVFILADLTAKLNAGGITSIKTPIAVTYRYFHRDLIPVQTGTITDFSDPLDRTALFVLETLTTTNQTV